jgi:hypothetical protein
MTLPHVVFQLGCMSFVHESRSSALARGVPDKPPFVTKQMALIKRRRPL